MKRIKARVAKRKSFFGRVWDLISDKTDTKGAFTSKALSLLVSMTFYTVSLLGTIFIGALLYLLYSGTAEKAIGEINIFFKVIISLFSFAGLLYMFIIWKASKEIDREKDRNYIVALFSGVTSFAALIVAIASLFVGVN